MTKKLQSIRGMNDILPSQSPYWDYLEQVLHNLMASYSYEEIRTPVVESTTLFKRTIGEETDIVSKEMYSFEDRNGDDICLRPEGTASCVRAAIQHGLIHNQIQRLWYFGPMFRRERPQKGRYRQFYQLGVEAFGLEGPDIDVEQIAMMARLFKLLRIDDRVRLEINSLGTAQCRKSFRDRVVSYFTQHQDELTEEERERLKHNPLRLLDSKNPVIKKLLVNAPVISDCWNDDAQAHFRQLCHLLDELGIDYVHNPLIVRGLDYYGLTVYEWVSDCLGAQGTVCAGGRYNNLVELLGGKSTPAVGFALGMERIITLMESNYTPDNLTDVYLIVGKNCEADALKIAEHIRDMFPSVRLRMNCGADSLKKQFKQADKSEAKVALILGEDELKSGELSIKYLRDEREQKRVSIDNLQNELALVLT